MADLQSKMADNEIQDGGCPIQDGGPHYHLLTSHLHTKQKNKLKDKGKNKRISIMS